MNEREEQDLTEDNRILMEKVIVMLAAMANIRTMDKGEREDSINHIIEVCIEDMTDADTSRKEQV